MPIFDRATENGNVDPMWNIGNEIFGTLPSYRKPCASDQSEPHMSAIGILSVEEEVNHLAPPRTGKKVRYVDFRNKYWSVHSCPLNRSLDQRLACIIPSVAAVLTSESHRIS